MLGVLRQLGGVFSPRLKRRLLLALVGQLIVSLAEVAGILAIGPLMLLITGAPVDSGLLGQVSQYLGSPSPRTLAILLALFVILAFVSKSLLGIGFRWWMLGMIAEEEVATSTELLRYYLRMPYVRHVERGVPDLIRTMNDAVGQFYGSVVLGSLSALVDGLTIVVVVIALAIAAPLPTFALFAYFLIGMALYQRAFRGKSVALGKQMLHLSRHIYMAAYHPLGGIKEIKLRHTGPFFVDEYRTARLESTDAKRLSSLINELPKHILEILFILGVAIMTVVIFWTNPTAEGTGLLTIFMAAGFRLLPTVVRVSASLTNMTLGLPAARDVIEELRAARASDSASDPDLLPVAPLPLEHGVSLDHVSFTYPRSDRQAVSDVSLEIPAGTSLALVGLSGSGKTTLVDLVLGLHAPSRGRITVDGLDIATRLPNWQSGLAMVPQEVYLLDRTLRENIAFGIAPDQINDEQVLRAVKRAQLGDVVAQLPDGLDMEVGFEGKRLSGGQRQRIGIARALYGEPRLLVLDEATSALDNVTERRVADAVSSLSGDVTVIIVAHRLSTVRHCDAVALMHEGRIEAVAPFDQLIAINPRFAEMVALGSLTGPVEAENAPASPVG